MDGGIYRKYRLVCHITALTENRRMKYWISSTTVVRVLTGKKTESVYNFLWGYPAGNHNQRNLALILKDMYAKIGIDLIPDEDDFSVYLNKFRDGKYDIMVLYTTWGNAYEPYSTLTEMRTDGSGFNMFQRGADDRELYLKQ